ncbi:hypothetical protein [Providencia stuartii]|uniref:hypothetical protein n=1 Tax=Providencia stuartii TaxID=588 RepID=UPI003D7F5F5D
MLLAFDGINIAKDIIRVNSFRYINIDKVIFGCFFRQFIFKKISDWNADHFFGGERTQKSPRGEGWGLG